VATGQQGSQVVQFRPCNGHFCRIPCWFYTCDIWGMDWVCNQYRNCSEYRCILSGISAIWWNRV